MYVCICNAVSDREIRAEVAAGARSLADITVALGVAAGCGCCRETAQRVVDEALCGGDCARCARRDPLAA
ncbi:MAG TPA: (2Fe-2S)-binding protein [Burkholderiaceae bacterium]|jgi:bacterioferritin-associated ferredoxin|nr:(2Fe-2S)-binding protein [Burkholderiaceae bacterium]